MSDSRRETTNTAESKGLSYIIPLVPPSILGSAAIRYAWDVTMGKNPPEEDDLEVGPGPSTHSGVFEPAMAPVGCQSIIMIPENPSPSIQVGGSFRYSEDHSERPDCRMDGIGPPTLPIP
ncbi:hypothetical protein FKP32DRAFT_232083 [Trametes sanguinea]|nr:hypothetical protein FKP32DRAFT_232083 [Trametes sanguinea]